jgi:adenylate kinase family enzyme
MQPIRQLTICISSESRHFVQSVLTKLSTPDVLSNFELAFLSNDFHIEGFTVTTQRKPLQPEHFALTVLSSSDVILFDMNSCGDDLLVKLASLIKNNTKDHSKNPKKLVLVSNVLTWECAQSLTKEELDKSFEEEEGGAVAEAEDAADQFQEELSENQDDVVEVGQPVDPQTEGVVDNQGANDKRMERFGEEDFMARIGTGAYLRMVGLENMALFLRSTCSWLTVNIVCPGVVYGGPDDPFRELMRMSWLQDPDTLDYLSDGSNELPMIHFEDLMLHLKFAVLENTSKYSYVFATDFSRKRRQKQLVKCMAVNVSKGRIRRVDKDQSVYSEGLRRVLSLNLPWKQGRLMRDYEARETARREQDDIEAQDKDEAGVGDAEQADREDHTDPASAAIRGQPPATDRLPLSYQWKCKEGLLKCIQSIKGEFMEGETLRPVKICVLGGPFTGKSTLASMLAKHYNVPLVCLDTLVQHFVNSKDKLGEDLAGFAEEFREREVANRTEAREKAIRQKKKAVPKAPTKEKIKVAYPLGLLVKMIAQRLRMNDCVNRGYVLDGLPDSFAMASRLFKRELIRQTSERDAGRGGTGRGDQRRGAGVPHRKDRKLTRPVTSSSLTFSRRVCSCCSAARRTSRPCWSTRDGVATLP